MVNQFDDTRIGSFDNRLLSAVIEIDGQNTVFDQKFYIKARGRKTANALQNECEVEIANLDAKTRNYLLTETSPFNQNRTAKSISIYAGRVSTGAFLVYTGNVTTAKISQPPDILLTLKSGTCHANKGKVGKRSGGKITKLSTIAGSVASNLGVSLRMETPDMSVANYAHNGDDLQEVDTVGKAGNCCAYIDDNIMVLKPVHAPLSGSVLDLNEQSGMIGIPEVTERGLKVKFLYAASVKLGGAINITSVLNPSCNGLFVIYKLAFDLTSRENAFYYEAECLKAKT